MYRNLNILGIVPARGGSKSIPCKNIKSFCGKPLLTWKAEAAQKSGVFDRLVLTTDDEEIASIGRRYGLETPFLRPAELAQDTTPSLPVIQHVASWLKDKEGYEPDAMVILEPTTPAVQPFHIREIVDCFVKTGADSVISMVEVPTAYRPPWQFTMDGDGRLGLWTGEPIARVIRRRQDLPLTYYRNSALYIFKPELLFAGEPSIYGRDVRGYLIERKYSMDLDTPEDWLEAEEKMSRLISEREPLERL